MLYLPTQILPSRLKTANRVDIAQAAIADAERYLDGRDAEEMARKIGFRGLKRLYYEDFMRLKSELK